MARCYGAVHRRALRVCELQCFFVSTVYASREVLFLSGSRAEHDSGRSFAVCLSELRQHSGFARANMPTMFARMVSGRPPRQAAEGYNLTKRSIAHSWMSDGSPSGPRPVGRRPDCRASWYGSRAIWHEYHSCTFRSLQRYLKGLRRPCVSRIRTRPLLPSQLASLTISGPV